MQSPSIKGEASIIPAVYYFSYQDYSVHKSHYLYYTNKKFKYNIKCIQAFNYNVFDFRTNDADSNINVDYSNVYIRELILH